MLKAYLRSVKIQDPVNSKFLVVLLINLNVIRSILCMFCKYICMYNIHICYVCMFASAYGMIEHFITCRLATLMKITFFHISVFHFRSKDQRQTACDAQSWWWGTQMAKATKQKQSTFQWCLWCNENWRLNIFLGVATDLKAHCLHIYVYVCALTTQTSDRTLS